MGRNPGTGEVIMTFDTVIPFDTVQSANTLVAREELLESFNPNQIMPVQYLLFVDVTRITDELADLRQLLFQVGGLGLALISLMSYVFSQLLIRPIAKTFELQKRFIADASHELKTPITIIKSNSMVLRSCPDETIGSQLEWLDYVDFAAERMSGLTTGLLTLAQLDNPNTNFQKQTFNLSDTTLYTLQTLKKRLLEKDITLKTNIEPNLIIHQDSEKINQVIMILLDNAIKYVDVGGWIELDVKRYRNRIQFSVANSGPGINKDQLARIFERFNRGDQSRNSEANSFGLGLAIAKGIIRQAEGRITAKSIPGERTTFTFQLKIDVAR
jgi:signal transduction histidine kinase